MVPRLYAPCKIFVRSFFMDKKQVRKSYKMDMVHFLRNYYGIDNENLISELCHLSHKDLKRIAPLYGIELVRTSFELVSSEQVAMGTIILVNDAFNNPAPYVNPNRVLSLNQEFDTELDIPYVSSVVEEIKFDKKGRQKSLKRIIKLKKGDKNG